MIQIEGQTGLRMRRKNISKEGEIEKKWKRERKSERERERKQKWGERTKEKQENDDHVIWPINDD